MDIINNEDGTRKGETYAERYALTAALLEEAAADPLYAHAHCKDRVSGVSFSYCIRTEGIYIDIGLEDILRLAAKDCPETYRRILKEEDTCQK